MNGDFERDFAATVAKILDGGYSLPDGRQLSGLEKDLALTYGCRNRGAHHLSGGGVINNRFGDTLGSALLNMVFLCRRVPARLESTAVGFYPTLTSDQSSL